MFCATTRRRESQNKLGPPTWLAVDAHGNLMRAGNVLDNGQAQTRTHRIVRGGLLRAVVLLKNVRQSMFTDANALVANAYLSNTIGQWSTYNPDRSRRM